MKRSERMSSRQEVGGVSIKLLTEKYSHPVIDVEGTSVVLIDLCSGCPNVYTCGKNPIWKIKETLN